MYFTPLFAVNGTGAGGAARGASPSLGRWLASLTPPSLQVGWTKDYEPWYIIDRFLNPFYDRWVFV